LDQEESSYYLVLRYCTDFQYGMVATITLEPPVA